VNRSKRPQKVALINLAGAADAREEADLLLADMAEAGTVYERRSGVEAQIVFVQVGGTNKLTGYGAVVLGLDIADACFEDALRGLDEGTVAYAMLICGDRVAEDALGILSILGESCDAQGLVWGGGVAVAHSQTVAAFKRSCRLGFWRRPTSEAIDGLLVAIRCGEEAGNIAAKQGVVRRAACWVLARVAG
jgi:hypothetical protein